MRRRSDWTSRSREVGHRPFASTRGACVAAGLPQPPACSFSVTFCEWTCPAIIEHGLLDGSDPDVPLRIRRSKPPGFRASLVGTSGPRRDGSECHPGRGIYVTSRGIHNGACQMLQGVEVVQRCWKLVARGCKPLTPTAGGMRPARTAASGGRRTLSTKLSTEDATTLFVTDCEENQGRATSASRCW